MPAKAEYRYDASTALALGRRELQEDAVATNFAAGSGLGYVVLADGMGGHAAGDVASRLVVQEVFEELDRQAVDPLMLELHAGQVLRTALDKANTRVARHAAARPQLRGMGATLVATLLVANRLYWISVGDSPLYLLRGRRMIRLNQEHSVARRMERMVLNGEISRQEADIAPDLDCLTSVLFGAAVREIDCRESPLHLIDGDIVIAASDGLLYLDEPVIARLIHENRDRPSAEIGARLLRELGDLDDPCQDNVSVCVVKVQEAAAQPVEVAPPRLAQRGPAAGGGTVQLRLLRQGRRLTYDLSSMQER